MFDIFSQPAMLHAISVHMPVALSILGLPLAFLTVVLPNRYASFRIAALVVYLALTASAVAAVETGEDAREQVPPDIRTEASKLLDQHEWMAEYVWMFGLGTALLLGMSLVPAKALRVPWVYRLTVGLAFAASISTAAWVGLTGHKGGELVYVHGIGTPQLSIDFERPEGTGEIPPDIDVEVREPTGDPEAEKGMKQPVDVNLEVEMEEQFLPGIRPIDPNEASKISFTKDVWPIIEEHCIECHGALKLEGGYDMMSVDAMIQRGEKAPEPGVIPGKPDESAIVKYIRGIYKPQMPKRAEPLSEEELHVIRSWILAGAVDDTQMPPTKPEPEPLADEPAPELPDESPANDPAGESAPPAPTPSTESSDNEGGGEATERMESEQAPEVEPAPVEEEPPLMPEPLEETPSGPTDSAEEAAPEAPPAMEEESPAEVSEESAAEDEAPSEDSDQPTPDGAPKTETTAEEPVEAAASEEDTGEASGNEPATEESVLNEAPSEDAPDADKPKAKSNEVGNSGEADSVPSTPSDAKPTPTSPQHESSSEEPQPAAPPDETPKESSETTGDVAVKPPEESEEPERPAEIVIQDEQSAEESPGHDLNTPAHNIDDLLDDDPPGRTQPQEDAPQTHDPKATEKPTREPDKKRPFYLNRNKIA